MDDITEKPYAGWLEATLADLVGIKLKSVAVVVLSEDDNDHGTYYFGAGAQELAFMASLLQGEAWFEMVKAHAAEIIKAADDDEEGA